MHNGASVRHPSHIDYIAFLKVRTGLLEQVERARMVGIAGLELQPNFRLHRLDEPFPTGAAQHGNYDLLGLVALNHESRVGFDSSR